MCFFYIVFLKNEADEKPNTYKDKLRITSDYYRITSDGNLEYVDDEGRRVVRYFKKL